MEVETDARDDLVPDHLKPFPLITDEVSEDDTAQAIGISKLTLRNWRSRGLGPKFMKLGKRVIYSEADVQAWVQEQRRSPRGVAS